MKLFFCLRFYFLDEFFIEAIGRYGVVRRAVAVLYFYAVVREERRETKFFDFGLFPVEDAMCDFLGVEIPEKKPEPEATDSVVAVTQTGGEGMGGVVARGYCPNCHCPSNIPYVVEGRLFYRPNRVLASPTGGVRCTQCGEILEMRCPVCGAPLNDGACCAVCGGAYVTPVLPEGVDPSAYARARRDEMLQLKALMQA